MELERTGVHHAALTRDLPLLPVDDASHLGRHDPMRLPDVHWRRANLDFGAVNGERERFDSSRNDDDIREWYQRSTTRGVVAPQQNTAGNERVRQDDEMMQMTEEPRERYFESTKTVLGYAFKTAERLPTHIEDRRVVEDRSRPSSSRYATTSQRPRTTSYVYSNDASASQTALARYGRQANVDSSETPTAHSLRQTRTEYLSPMEDSRYSHFMPEDRPRFGYDRFGFDPSDRSSEEVGNLPERGAISSATLPHRLRLELICQTVSRDETSSEDAKISSFVKLAMEPHVRKAQTSNSSGLDTSTSMPLRDTITTTTTSKKKKLRLPSPRKTTYTSKAAY